MKTVFVIPQCDVVRDPQSKNPLPKDGATVEFNTYWKRRVKTGDVIIASPQVKKEIIVEEKKSEKYYGGKK